MMLFWAAAKEEPRQS